MKVGFLILLLLGPSYGWTEDSCVSSALRTATYGPTRAEAQVIAENQGNLMMLTPLNPDRAKELNNRVLAALKREAIPPAGAQTKGAFTQEEIVGLYRTVNNNHQVQESLCGRYQGSQDYGFCWGRAMAVHLKALQSRLVNKSVRKLWVVGDLSRDPKALDHWKYHVTTLVRSTDGDWYAIDPIFSRPMRMEEWVSTVQRDYDHKKTMRVLATPAQRFNAASKAPYNRADLVESSYNGFFIDLMEEISRQNTGKKTIWAKIKDQADQARSRASSRTARLSALGIATVSVAEVNSFLDVMEE